MFAKKTGGRAARSHRSKFYASRADEASASQGRSIPRRRLRSSASAEGAGNSRRKCEARAHRHPLGPRPRSYEIDCEDRLREHLKEGSALSSSRAKDAVAAQPPRLLPQRGRRKTSSLVPQSKTERLKLEACAIGAESENLPLAIVSFVGRREIRPPAGREGVAFSAAFAALEERSDLSHRLSEYPLSVPSNSSQCGALLRACSVTFGHDQTLVSPLEIRRDCEPDVLGTGRVAALAEEAVFPVLVIVGSGKLGNPLVCLAQQSQIKRFSMLRDFHELPIVPLAATVTRVLFWGLFGLAQRFESISDSLERSD